MRADSQGVGPLGILLRSVLFTTLSVLGPLRIRAARETAWSGDANQCERTGARGSTEFGEFVSLGRLEPGGEAPSFIESPLRTKAEYEAWLLTRRAEPQLTLARRYIADKDSRVKLSAQQVADLCGSRQAPWEALPWKA